MNVTLSFFLLLVWHAKGSWSWRSRLVPVERNDKGTGRKDPARSLPSPRVPRLHEGGCCQATFLKISAVNLGCHASA